MQYVISREESMDGTNMFKQNIEKFPETILVEVRRVLGETFLYFLILDVHMGVLVLVILMIENTWRFTTISCLTVQRLHHIPSKLICHYHIVICPPLMNISYVISLIWFCVIRIFINQLREHNVGIHALADTFSHS